MRKPRQKKQPKPQEDVQIFFRVRTMAEQLDNDFIDPGFASSPVPSDNQSEADRAEDPEEEKQPE